MIGITSVLDVLLLKETSICVVDERHRVASAG